MVLVLLITVTTGCATITGAPRHCPPDDGQDLHSLDRCTHLQGDLRLAHRQEENLPPLSLRHVQGDLIIAQSPHLQDLSALRHLEEIDGDLHLINLPALTSLDGLSRLRAVGGEVHLIDLGLTACQVDQWLDGLASPPTRVVALGLSDHAPCPAPVEAPASLALSSLPEIDEIQGGRLLQGLHPELRDRARLLYGLLQQEQIEIVFISGHRPYDPNYRPNRLASWHNLGMAFDLNIVGRPYAYFEEDQEKWERIGELAQGLGMIWGIRYDDIFHFEWHPNFHARIRDHEFSLFQDLAGSHLTDHHEVFPLFDYHRVGAEDPTCFGGCQVIPDDDLRRLLRALQDR